VFGIEENEKNFRGKSHIMGKEGQKKLGKELTPFISAAGRSASAP
jgi:hypothetical protein